MKVRIGEIVVGERRREDMGDIRELADSIKKYGLLHPVVVDDQMRLVAGGRRLEALKLLGWEEVEVRSLGELTEKELRAIELEENLRRKDLTEYEKSRDMVELVRVVREQAKIETCATVAQVLGKGGHSKTDKAPGSYRDISQRTGIPESTIRLAEKHVKAVEEFPVLKSNPKVVAIQTARELRSMPQEERQEKISAIEKEQILCEQYEKACQEFPEIKNLPMQEGVEIAEKLRLLPQQTQAEHRKYMKEIQAESKAKQEKIDETYRIKGLYRDAINKLASLTLEPEHIEMWLHDETRDRLRSYLDTIDQNIESLGKLREVLLSVVKGPRRVEGGVH